MVDVKPTEVQPDNSVKPAKSIWDNYKPNITQKETKPITKQEIKITTVSKPKPLTVDETKQWLSNLEEDKTSFQEVIKNAEKNKKNIGEQIIKLAQYHTSSLNNLNSITNNSGLKEYITSSVSFFSDAEKEITDFQKNYDEPIKIANEGIKSIESFEQSLKNGTNEDKAIEIFKARTETYPKATSLALKEISEITENYGKLSDLYSDVWQEHMDRIKAINNSNILLSENITKLDAIKQEATNSAKTEINSSKRLICTYTTQFNGLFGKTNTTPVCNL